MVSEGEADKPLGAWGFLGLGGLNLGAILAGFGVGWLADAKLGSSPVCTLVGLAVGVTAGIAGSWIRIRQFLRP